MGLFNTIKNKLNKAPSKPAVKTSDIINQYRSHPSFVDKLPWLEFSDEANIMLLEDGVSVGAALEVRDIPCESRPEDKIDEICQKLAHLLSTAVPCLEENPWVMQIFVFDELDLSSLNKKLTCYIQDKSGSIDAFAQHYLDVMAAHFKLICREEGLFKDPMSEITFRGRNRRIVLTLYRRFEKKEQARDTNPVEDVKTVLTTLMSRLKQTGFSVRRLTGRHLYEWWVRWFNPSPEAADGDTAKLLERFPYPDKKPRGFSFTENLFFTQPESKDDTWYFDKRAHRVMVLQDLKCPITTGVISRERSFGGGKVSYALLDKLPPGTVYTQVVVFEGKQTVERHLKKLEKAAVGQDTVVDDIINNIKRARVETSENNNRLFRTCEAIYYRGDDEALHKIEQDIKSELADSDLFVYDNESLCFPLDTYLRFLPFNFNVHFDKRYSLHANYKYALDVAKMLPVYGRSRGDGKHPLFLYFNRAGEPFMFDHLNKNFKMSNSHMVVVGTTGAGKSVALNNLILSLSAVHNPHIVALEVGGSFDLTERYLNAHGRKTRALKFELANPIPMNPYAEGYRALDKLEQEERLLKRVERVTRKNTSDNSIPLERLDKLNQEIGEQQQPASVDEKKCADERDILNEMLLATRLMITRGQDKEEEGIDLTDMSLMYQTLVSALKSGRDEGIPQVRVEHMAQAFAKRSESEANPRLKSRLNEFALRLEYYVNDIARGQFVNHDSIPLAEYDFLQIDFGFMQRDDYKDLLNIVCLSVLSNILALAERNKASGRPTILIIDEAHVLLRSPVVATFITLMAKVSRKIGLWLIPCTQNIEDFKGTEARKVLSMMETWLCLALEKNEIKLLEQFKSLTTEERALLSNLHKYPGLYSEGVLLGKRHVGLFRNIPPRISLSLAMTEQDERTERKQIQEENNLTELQAVEYMADEMSKVKTQTVTEDGDFL